MKILITWRSIDYPLARLHGVHVTLLSLELGPDNWVRQKNRDKGWHIYQKAKSTKKSLSQLEKPAWHTPNVTRPGPLAFGLKPSTLSFSVGSDLLKKLSIKTCSLNHFEMENKWRHFIIPQKVHQYYGSGIHCYWPFKLLNLIYRMYWPSYATMHTDYLFLYESSKRKIVEKLIKPCPRPYSIIFSLYISKLRWHTLEKRSNNWTLALTIRSMHSRRKPKRAFMSAASWFPRIKWTFSGYSIYKKKTPAKVSKTTLTLHCICIKNHLFQKHKHALRARSKVIVSKLCCPRST